jgi:hypothetical protein
MKKRTIFLVALVIFFPLNNLPMYANDATAAVAIVNPASFLVDTESYPEPSTNGVVSEYVNAFAVVAAETMKLALTGYAALNEQGKISNKDIITIVDFSKPSTEERMFVINLKTKAVMAKSLVAHGRNSGENWAEKFSNNSESYQSSLGFYIASETYNGKHGYSLRLDGQETGINDKARARGVVIHGAEYVSKQFIASTGRLGRSQGCPALPMDQYEKIISLIKEGTCLFIYHPDKSYVIQSPLLKAYNESCLAELVTTLEEQSR